MPNLPSARLFSDSVLFVGGCILFMVAKSIATNGAVTIDAFEFWLLAALPFGGIALISRPAGTRGPLSQPEAFRFLAEAWVGSLLVFVVLRASLVAESFDIATSLKSVFVLAPSSLAPTFVYSGGGLAVATALHAVRAGSWALPPALLLTAFVLAALLLHVLLFLVPAA